MPYPTQPSYGLIENEHHKVAQIARDVELMATAMLGADTPMINGGAITTDQAVLAGSFYTCDTLGANTTLTLPVAVTANNRILIMRTSTDAWTLALGTVFTMPASKAGIAVLRANGAAWILEHLVLDGKMVYTTVGHCKIVAPAGGSTVTLAGNLTTTGGNATIAVPAAGAACTLGGNFSTTGAFATSLTQGGNTTLILPTTNCTLASTANITGKKRTIRLPVNTFVDAADGTPLAKYAADDAGTVGFWSDGTKAAGIRWNNTGGTTKTVATSFRVPADCDVTVAPVVKIKCAKTGATLADATTFVIGMYAQTDGAAYDAGANLGATSAAITGDAVAKTVQLSSTAMTVFPGLTSGVTLTINPTAAKLATDDLIIFDVAIEYTPAVG